MALSEFKPRVFDLNQGTMWPLIIATYYHDKILCDSCQDRLRSDACGRIRSQLLHIYRRCSLARDLPAKGHISQAPLQPGVTMGLFWPLECE